MSDYPYPRVNAGGYNLADKQFAQAVEALLPGIGFRVRCDAAICVVDTDVPLDAAQEADLTNLAVNFDDLQAVKDARSFQIDQRTQQLIAEGVEFPPASGMVFSLSANAQTSLIAADNAREDPLFVYPVNWNTIDDGAVFVIPDAPTLHAFYLTALGTVRAWLDSGTAIKDQIRACTTPAQVAAVPDNR